jgi:uncharacterized protein
MRRVMENATPPSTPPPPDPRSTAPPGPNDARNWAMWCHLSALSGLVVPFGNILGPLVLWQMKRNEMPLVEEQGKESLNFQLSALIYLLAGSVIAVIGAIFCVGFLLIPVLVVIYLGSLVLAVIAGLKANDGVLYRYPLNLRLIK